MFPKFKNSTLETLSKIKFEYINGLFRKQADKTTPAELSQIDKIDYMIFDCFDINNLKMTFEERYNIIKGIFKSKFRCPFFSQ